MTLEKIGTQRNLMPQDKLIEFWLFGRLRQIWRTIVRRLYDVYYASAIILIISFLNLPPSHDTATLQPPTTTASNDHTTTIQ
jgi:hypothetical protein